jgi:5'-nucleotidase/UDP-sugar diphosphatase
MLSPRGCTGWYVNLRLLIPIIVAVLAVIAAVFLSFCLNPPPGDESLTMIVIATSDLQSQVEPFHNSTGSYVGGFGRISTMRKVIGKEADATLLISSGDDVAGTLYDMYSGRPEMESMTAAGYDVICPGNHEFDFGAEKYRNATGFAGFPIVCSNMEIDDPGLSEVIVQSVILEESGVKIGVFGLMTPDLTRISSPGEGVWVDPDVCGISRKMVEELRSQGADLVIAVTHTGVEIDRQIAGEVAGIDLIVGGHDHEYVYETVTGPDKRETIIVQDGIRGERLGVLRFTYSGKRIRNPEWSWVWLDNSTESDPVVEGIIEPYLSQYRERLTLAIGKTLTQLDTRKSTVRGGEAAAGNMITDAWQDWFPESQIVFINGGGIRGDTVYPPGNITYLILYEMLPYRDEIVAIQMKGSDIRQALECSASALGPGNEGIDSGGFLQVSGLHYSIDMNATPYSADYNGSELVKVKDAGSRVTSVTVEEPDGSYTPLDDERTYAVLVNAWLAGGGDGYWIFTGSGNKTFTTVYDIDPVAEYVRKNTPVAPVIEGRIIICG